MADEKKDAGGKDAKPKADKPSTESGGMYLFTFLVIIFIIWIITGGPNKNPESRNNQWISGSGQTYHEDFFGQPGSVTNTLPFLK